MAPSVTPSTVGGPNNPGLRLYKFETNTGQVRGGGAHTFSIISRCSRSRSICATCRFQRAAEMYRCSCVCVCCTLRRFWITRSTILICPKQIQTAKRTGWPSTRCSSITSCRRYRRSLFMIWRTDLRNRTITPSSGTLRLTDRYLAFSPPAARSRNVSLKP